jgi:tetratricopeptide (TPR) repeat protein
VYTYRSTCYLALNQRDKAAKDLETAAKKDPDDTETLLLLGTLKENAGDYDGAVELFTRLVSLRPDDPVSHFNLGVALGKKGMIRQAINELTKSIELNPRYREAYLKRGIAFEFQGDAARAKADFGRALALPEDKQDSTSLREPVNTAQLKENLTTR